MVSQDALHKILPKSTHTQSQFLTGFHKKRTSLLFLNVFIKGSLYKRPKSFVIAIR